MRGRKLGLPMLISTAGDARFEKEQARTDFQRKRIDLKTNSIELELVTKAT
jgi:hypothetical protein